MREARESARVGSERFIVRPAAAGDITQISGVLERGGLSSYRPEILEFSLAKSRMFVGCAEGRVVGVAGCIRFGRTGWLGNVAVDDDVRGRGLGTAISRTAVDCLRQAGVETVLLTATESGQPVYERLGFTDEGVSYGIWEQQQAPALACDRSATVQPADADEIIRQDAEATGEDRRSYLAPFAGRARVAAGPGHAGYRVGLPWGGGPVIAANPASARSLIVDMIRTSPVSRLAFPEMNAHGAALAVSLGFRLAGRVRRMRLGPSVPGYRPGAIYNVFSLAAG
jgi:N-acetylglutamate synthase-like GNAT family acetyltransferase